MRSTLLLVAARNRCGEMRSVATTRIKPLMQFLGTSTLAVTGVAERSSPWLQVAGKYSTVIQVTWQRNLSCWRFLIGARALAVGTISLECPDVKVFRFRLRGWRGDARPMALTLMGAAMSRNALARIIH